ncbi:type VII secretion protein [Pseudoclavibacter chungangensis]|uniref:Type VII secretion protein n=1 Tax=Pseudoclavibacter chungangensis TaxID=587635 RepID=A0A7J5C2G8_9MICO|nr:type VII secretion protein [Pseudoclavibacter chungangensis]KAB1660282.1 type VII secretion protein [Pseudoclavibacter chungangensis]NYJ65630.1 hypothetical protein [Pseudoclavibacter chungangensis]
MADKFHWDEGAVQTKRTQLKNGFIEIETKLNELNQAIVELTTQGSGGFYTQQGSDAFQTSYDTFTLGAKNVVDGINGMEAFLDKVGQGVLEYDLQIKAGTGA